jgi:hypothetical protein
MIEINAATNFRIFKGTEQWTHAMADRTYLIDTRLGLNAIDDRGLQAVLAVALSHIPDTSEDLVNELNDAVNDMLLLWRDGQLVRVDARRVPFSYWLIVDGKVRIDDRPYYLDVTREMNDIEFERLRREAL